MTTALNAKPQEFLQAFNDHFICNHILRQALVPGMKAAGFGRIINIISTSVKQPIPGLGVSNTIRAAVANWSKTLANELGPFVISINVVFPGFTKTSRTDYVIEKRAADREKMADEVLVEIEAQSRPGA